MSKMREAMENLEEMLACDDADIRTDMYAFAVSLTAHTRTFRANKPYIRLEYERAGDLAKDPIFSGKYHVYYWMHLDGRVFYVGQGKGNRCKEHVGRPDGFTEHLKTHDVVVVVPYYNTSQELALKLERKLIEHFADTGHPLVNLQYNDKSKQLSEPTGALYEMRQTSLHQR